MYRHKPLLTHINVLFDDGGLGDMIARLPPLKYIYKNHPHVKVYAWVPDFFYDFAKNCLRGTEDRILLGKWSQGATGFKSGYHTVSFKNNPYNNLSQHMTEHAFHLICNTVPDDKHDYNYLQPDLTKVDINGFNLPENYVVITTGYTSSVREFKPEYINSISQYVLSKGYTPVFLGKTITKTGLDHEIKGEFSNDIDLSLGLNLIDKTNLFEAARICENRIVIGLDNGLLHLAATSAKTWIIGGFTTVKPEHRMPYRGGVKGRLFTAVVPPETLKCRFCQSNWTFSYTTDFTKCHYEDNKCCEELTAEHYIRALKSDWE